MKLKAMPKVEQIGRALGGPLWFSEPVDKQAHPPALELKIQAYYNMLCKGFILKPVCPPLDVPFTYSI